jgi:putative ABC transport system permease protein
VADPAQLADVFDLGVTSGSMNGAQFAASASTASANGWKVGRQVPVSFSDGASSTLTLGAIYTAGDPLGDYLLASSIWAAHTPQATDQAVYVSLAPGADRDTVISALSSVEAKYAGVTVDTKAQFVANQAATVNTYLDIVYLMLALAIVIALLGIANTLSLAVYERTREIGLIRAVGATGEQIRSMIRWEAVITTLIGTVTGLVLGCFLGWTVVTAGASGSGGLGVFTLPVVRLLVILVVCALAGVLAGVRPARRAARLDVLGAIAAP